AAIGYVFALLLRNPIALTIGLIVGLVQAFMHLWETNEGFRESVMNVWNAIKNIINPIISEISEFVKQIWGQLVAWWEENNDKIYAKAQEIWGFIVDRKSVEKGKSGQGGGCQQYRH